MSAPDELYLIIFYKIKITFLSTFITADQSFLQKVKILIFLTDAKNTQYIISAISHKDWGKFPFSTLMILMTFTYKPQI